MHERTHMHAHTHHAAQIDHAENTSRSTCSNESSYVSNVIAFACECNRSSQLHSHWVGVVALFRSNTYLIRTAMSGAGVFNKMLC